jgi:hypothetical protein
MVWGGFKIELKLTKKRPPVIPVWMLSRSGQPEGRGAAITRKCPLALPCARDENRRAQRRLRHIFWTGYEYMEGGPIWAGSIG